MPSGNETKFLYGVDLEGSEMVNPRLHQVSTVGDFATPSIDGQIGFLSTINAEHIVFTLGGALKSVPRLDLAENVTGQWNFAPGSTQAPFTLGSNAQGQKVTGFNADQVDGFDTATANTANTIVARDAGGRAQVSDPVSDLDAVNLQFFNAALTNRQDKAAVKVATTGALPTNTISGNVMTASANGAFPSIDGVALSVGDSILVLQEGDTDSSDNAYLGTSNRKNGIYTLTNAGSAGTAWQLTRRSDSDSSGELTTGVSVFVDQGTANKNSVWSLLADVTLTTNGSDGTTVTFRKSGGNTLYQAGNGLVLVGDTFHFSGSGSFSIGDLFYASSTSAVSRLTAAAAGNALISGGAGTAPSWGKIGLTTHVSGTLPIANGGTNSTTSLNNGRLMISSSGAIVERAALTASALIVGDATSGVAILTFGTGNQIVGMNSAGNANEYKSFTVSAAGTVTAGTWNGTVIGLGYGGSNKDLSAAASGSIIWKDSDSFEATGALNGIVQGNGASAPSAINGTNNTFPLWSSSAPYLKDSTITDTGTIIEVLNRQLRVRGANPYAQVMETTTGNLHQIVLKVDTTNSLTAIDSTYGTGPAWDLAFQMAGVIKWSMKPTGVLESNGAQNIQSSTGALTLATAGGNGNIVLTAHGTGVVSCVSNVLPSSAGSATLGTSSVPWGTVYSNNFRGINSAAGQTADVPILQADFTGASFDTTSVARAAYGAYLLVNGTRLSGSNPLTNYGLYVSTSGAQTNYAVYVAAGLVNLQTLTASKVVFTDASKNLTSTGTVGVDQGGTGTTSAFTAGSVVFAGSGGAYGQDNASFFWDATNHRLGLGTTSPQSLLHVNGNMRGDGVNNAFGGNSGPDSRFGIYYYGNMVGDGTTITAIRSSPVVATAVTSHASAFRGSVIVNSGVTQPVASAFYAQDASGAGVVTSQAGVVIENLTKGTNNTGLLIGTGTIPSGNFAIYVNSGNVNLQPLTASKVVFTDASKNLTSSGTVGVTQGGTGTSTQFTAGSVVFAGSSGVYGQDNDALNWDNTNKMLRIASGTGVDASSFGGQVPLLCVSSRGTYGSSAAGSVFWNHQVTASNNASVLGMTITNTGTLSGTGTTSTGLLISVGNAVTNIALQVDSGSVRLNPLTASRVVLTNASKELVSAAYALPSSIAANQLLYGSSSTQVSALATANSSILGTNGSGVPAWITDLPAAITKGGKAIAIGYSTNLATSATSYTVTHNLGTSKLVVQLRDTATGKLAHTAFTVADSNTLTVAFRVAPTAGKFDVNIFAIL